MKNKADIFMALSLLSQIGLAMALPIIMCIIFGAFLDKHLHTGVVFLVIFCILGVMAAFRNLFVFTKRMNK